MTHDERFDAAMSGQLAYCRRQPKPTIAVPRDRLMRVARHEASHAVAALCLDRLFPVCWVRLWMLEVKGRRTFHGSYFQAATPPSLIERLHTGQHSRLDRAHARKDALVRIAGGAISKPSNGDLAGCRQMIRPLCRDEAEYEQRLEVLTREANALIAARMPVVNTLAVELAERCILDAAEIREIGRKAGAKPYPLKSPE